MNRPTGEVLVGNHRVMAARELGWTEIAACFVEVDDEHARRILLADNRVSDLAGYDEQALADLLVEVGADLTGTGYSRADLDALLDAVAGEVAGEDDAPPVPVEPVTRPGDLVRLGEHLVVCGDAGDERVVARLFKAGEEAACLVTDPPYGTSYVGKTRARLRITNDQPGALAELLPSVFGAADGQLAEGAALYVFTPSGAALPRFVDSFVGVGWVLRQSLVWVKDSMVLGHADYQHRHELVLYGFKPASAGGRLGRGGRGWYGDNRQVSVFEVPRPRAAHEHPTMKPVELLAGWLCNSTRRGELVLDPFAGSGSTLVACQRLGRRARLVEVDPAYCDVIIDRWQRLTGGVAIREQVA